MSDSAPKADFYKERIFPVIFMLLVTVVFIALVSGIYLATRDNVIRNEQLYLKRAVLYSSGLTVPETSEGIDEMYADRIEEVLDDGDSARYYVVRNSGGGTSGYVFPAFGPGLWGEIEAVVGFEADLQRLTGVDFIKQKWVENGVLLSLEGS